MLTIKWCLRLRCTVPLFVKLPTCLGKFCAAGFHGMYYSWGEQCLLLRGRKTSKTSRQGIFV